MPDYYWERGRCGLVWGGGGGEGGGGGGGWGGGGGEESFHLCYGPRIRAINGNVIMVAYTRQHTVQAIENVWFKLMNLVNMIVSKACGVHAVG